MEEDNMTNYDNRDTCRIEVPGPVKDAFAILFLQSKMVSIRKNGVKNEEENTYDTFVAWE